MKKNDDVFKKHILEAIKKIESYLTGVDYDDFIEDDMRADAVVRELEIIGEAVKNLSSEFKRKYRSVSWKEIAGMRDKLIHGYFGVDFQIVWRTCHEDIISLKSEIEKILKGEMEDL